MTSASMGALAHRQDQPRAANIGTHSPCIGVCSLDQATGWCQGCGRTGDEISRWGNVGETERSVIWGDIPARLAALGASRRMMPWSPEGILALALATIREHPGHWVIAPDGNRPASFATGRHNATVMRREGVIVAVHNEARFTLNAHEKLRAFGFGPPTDPTAIVLTLPGGRIAFPAREKASRMGGIRRVETTLAEIDEPLGNAPPAMPLPTFDLPGWASVVATFIAEDYRPDSR